MSHEARTIRPFVDLGKIDALLTDAVLHFGDAICPANSSVALDTDPHTFLLRPAKIEWVSDDVEFRERIRQTLDSVSASGVSPEQLTLLGFVATSYLKAAETVFSIPLSDLDNLQRVMTLTEPDRARAFDASHHGFALDVYVLLNETVEARPLLPWRVGTWLAHARFAIVTDAARTLFRLTPMDAAKKEALGLGPKAIRYLYLDDHDPLEPFEEQADEPVFYVDERLLGQLNATARTPGSKAMQLQLAVDFTSAVLTAASRHAEIATRALEDVEGSLLYRVIRAAAGAGATEADRQALFSRVAEDPGWVAAQVENAIDIQGGVLDSLRGVET